MLRLRTPTMRALDEWVGVPTCLLLVLWHALLLPLRRLIRLLRRRPRGETVAVFKFLGMGSILLCAPVVRQLRKQKPSARIMFVTFAENRRVVDFLQISDETLTVRSGSLLAFAWDTLTVVAALRRRRVSIVLDCEFFSKYSVVVSYLTGAPVRAGYYLREVWRKTLLTHHAYYNHYRHAQENFGMVLRSIGLTFTADEEIHLSGREQPQRDFRSLRRHPIVLAVNPNASDVIKLDMRRWRRENFLALSARLLERYDCELWFVGSSSESDYCQGIVDEMSRQPAAAERVVNWAGRTTIDDLVALLRASDMLITNDSGVMHLAAAAGVEVCAIFGAETPRLYSPVGRGHIIFSQTGLYCHPCLHVYNRKENVCINPQPYSCLSETHVDDVFAALTRRLDERTAGVAPAEDVRRGE